MLSHTWTSFNQLFLLIDIVRHLFLSHFFSFQTSHISMYDATDSTREPSVLCARAVFARIEQFRHSCAGIPYILSTHTYLQLTYIGVSQHEIVSQLINVLITSNQHYQLQQVSECFCLILLFNFNFYVCCTVSTVSRDYRHQACGTRRCTI